MYNTQSTAGQQGSADFRTGQLDQFHQYQNHHNRNGHNFRAETLVSVADSQIAQAAAADRACHRRITDQR